MSRLKILITGAGGFVGSNLSEALKDHELYLLEREEASKNLGNGEKIIQDLSKPLDIKKLPNKLDVVIHLAAAVGSSTYNRDLTDININGTKRLLEYAKGVKIGKFIFASTIAVYGTGEKDFSEDSILKPESPYAESKVKGEKLVKSYSNFFDTIIFRFTDPYGPRCRNGTVGSIISKFQNKEKIVFYNNGRNSKINPIFITELVQITLKSLDLNGSYIINLGGPDIKSPKEILNLIMKIKGERNSKVEYLINADKKDLVSDITLQTSLFGYPKVTIEKGLKKTLTID